MLKPELHARRLGPQFRDFDEVLRRDWPDTVRTHLLPIWQKFEGGVGFDADVAIQPVEASGFEGADGHVSVAGLLAPVAGPLDIDAISAMCTREGVPHLPIACADGGHPFILSGDDEQIFLWLRDTADGEPRFFVAAASLGAFIDALSAREPIASPPCPVAVSGLGLDELSAKSRQTH